MITTHSTAALQLEAHSRFKDFAFDAKGKKVFHQLARKVLSEIAAELDHEESDVRSNLGGVAVSGEITLHTNRIYVQISKGAGEKMAVMFRSVESSMDFTGGPNNFMSLKDLSQNYEIALDKFRKVSRV